VGGRRRGARRPARADIITFVYYGVLTDGVDAMVFTPDAPASLDTPFMPHGFGIGSFNLERTENGQMQIASGDFSIPEPASWTMMLVGLGGVSAAMRRGRERFAGA
jgi:hypothetical protein